MQPSTPSRRSAPAAPLPAQPRQAHAHDTPARPIGGFFPLHLGLSGGPGLLDAWLGRHSAFGLFENARSCVWHLLKSHAAKRVWIPAYACTELADAARASGAEVAFFPLSDRLEPDAGFLEERLRSGDFCLAIDYFGKDPGEDFRRLVRARGDIHWVEDRAQAWSTGLGPWGRWVIYSPRKLIGVPDGGILIDTRGEDAPPRHARARRSTAFIGAALSRYEDRDESDNARWYALSRRHEASMRATMRPMSRISEAILRGADPQPLAERRRANFQLLHTHLGALALYAADPSPWVPSGFPIRVPNAEKLWKHLCAQGVFAQRHWARLPAPRQRFAREHRLARELLTLPCDHRHDATAMMRIVELARQGA